MASSILSCSLRLRLTSIFKSPNRNFGGARMMSTTVSGVNSRDSVLLGPSSPPWLMLPPAFEGGGGNMVHNFYSLVQNKVVSFNERSEYLLDYNGTSKIVGSSHGWLALFNGRNNCDLFLSNPLTGRQVKFPPIHNLPIPKENLDGGYVSLSKVIISCDAEQEDCRAMMIFNTVDSLAFCCPGRSTEWTPIGALRRPPDYDVARCYEDLVYSSRDNLFFCLTDIDSNDLEGWDLRDPNSPRLSWSNQDDLLGRQNYLAWLEQADESLVVI